MYRIDFLNQIDEITYTVQLKEYADCITIQIVNFEVGVEEFLVGKINS